MTDVRDEGRYPSEAILPPCVLNGVAVRHQPEKRLMLAVLEGAVSDFQKYATATTGRGRFLFAEADGWFRSASSEWPFDFEHICDALGIEASFVRAGLRRWREARRRERAAERRVIHFPFRRVSGLRHAIAAGS